MREPVDDPIPDIPEEAVPLVRWLLDSLRKIKELGGFGKVEIQCRDGRVYEPHTCHISISESFADLKKRKRTAQL